MSNRTWRLEPGHEWASNDGWRIHGGIKTEYDPKGEAYIHSPDREDRYTPIRVADVEKAKTLVDIFAQEPSFQLLSWAADRFEDGEPVVLPSLALSYDQKREIMDHLRDKLRLTPMPKYPGKLTCNVSSTEWGKCHAALTHCGTVIFREESDDLVNALLQMAASICRNRCGDRHEYERDSGFRKP